MKLTSNMSTSKEESSDSLIPKGRVGAQRSHRDRRDSYRVPLTKHVGTEWSSACRLTDISTGGVGFLAPRDDASLLEGSLVLIHVAEATLFRAVVQRVDLGGSSAQWVKVGARFISLATHERAALCALVTAECP